MSFGPDLNDMLDDIGSSFTILRDSGNASGEKLIYKVNRQVTKPFIREYFLEAMFQYDTVATVGDVIKFDDNRACLVINLTPRQFENQAFDNQGTLYKCNVSGEIKRYSGEVFDPDTYQKHLVWNTIKSNCYGLLTEDIFGNYQDQDEPIGKVENKALVLYVPTSYNVQENDRIEPISGEFYQVNVVEKRRISLGIDTIKLTEDTRGTNNNL